MKIKKGGGTTGRGKEKRTNYDLATTPQAISWPQLKEKKKKGRLPVLSLNVDRK